MSAKTALVTNALDYVGPPAVAALLQCGFQVAVHDSSFAQAALRDKYAQDHPGAVPL